MPDSLSSPLACGDSVCFYAKVSRPFSEKELTGFDYGDYLLRKGISGTALAYAGNWMTEWERTFITVFRYKIVAVMKSIAALPNRIFT